MILAFFSNPTAVAYLLEGIHRNVPIPKFFPDLSEFSAKHCYPHMEWSKQNRYGCVFLPEEASGKLLAHGLSFLVLTLFIRGTIFIGVPPGCSFFSALDTSPLRRTSLQGRFRVSRRSARTVIDHAANQYRNPDDARQQAHSNADGEGEHRARDSARPWPGDEPRSPWVGGERESGGVFGCLPPGANTAQHPPLGLNLAPTSCRLAFGAAFLLCDGRALACREENALSMNKNGSW